MNKILDDIKLNLGAVYSEVTDFDQEIISRINECIPMLYQLGIGSKPLFSLTTGNETWEQYINSDYVPLVKKYIAGKVKMTFDPPSSSVILNSLQNEIREAEFRLLLIGNKGDDI